MLGGLWGMNLDIAWNLNLKSSSVFHIPYSMSMHRISDANVVGPTLEEGKGSHLDALYKISALPDGGSMLNKPEIFFRNLGLASFSGA